MNTNVARERIAALTDAGSFQEYGALITPRVSDMTPQPADAPSDGVITGCGLVDGRPVFIYSQDVSALGGTIGEMHCRKINALYDQAMQMGVPVVAMLDSQGLRLKESVDALHGLGRIYFKQVEASGRVPQIAMIYGNCGGGMELFASMSDFVIVKKDAGRIFVNSPDTIPGNRKELCDNASSQFQEKEAGIVDFVGTEEEMAGLVRNLLQFLPSSCVERAFETECTDDLNRACEGFAAGIKNASYLISEVADDREFFPLKTEFAPEITVGFIRINGRTVGAVANNGEETDEEGNVIANYPMELTPKGCFKAASFVRFCDAFEIPVVSFVSVTGYEKSLHAEGALPRTLPGLVAAYVKSTVPKLTIVTGKVFGSAYVAMNSKSIGADFVYAWEGTQIAPMEPELAAQIIEPGADAAKLREVAAAYTDLQGSTMASARRGYIDLIISPQETRKHIIQALELLYSKHDELPVKKHCTK